jgi:hypothetical protein
MRCEARALSGQGGSTLNVLAIGKMNVTWTVKTVKRYLRERAGGPRDRTHKE